MTKQQTLGQRLRELQATVRDEFRLASETNDEARILKLRKNIEKLGKLYADLRKEFDTAVDMKDAGMFGADFAPNVTRLRKPSPGRPASVKTDELVDLDL